MAVQGLQESCAQYCHSCRTSYAKSTSSASRSVAMTCAHRASDARDFLAGGGAQLHDTSPCRQGRISSVVSFSGGSPIDAVESSGMKERASSRLGGRSGSHRLFCSPRGIILRILNEICPLRLVDGQDDGHGHETGSTSVRPYSVSPCRPSPSRPHKSAFIVSRPLGTPTSDADSRTMQLCLLFIQ